MPMQVGAGVAVFVWYADLLLVGRRAGAHEPGTWSVPGGWIERYESPGVAAVREVAEETGIPVTDPRYVGWSNDAMPKFGLHCITLHFECRLLRDNPETLDQPTTLEPDKFQEVCWMPVSQLLGLPLFTPTRNGLRTQGWPC